jgi:hypothetical protein
VIILQTMREYLAANKQMPNAVPSFVAQPDGTVGIRTADGLLQPRLFLETQVFCSWDLRAHPEEAARFLSVNHPGLFPAVTVAQVKGWLEDAKADIEKGESCMDPARVLPKTADHLAASIVRFEVTGTARAMPWVRASGSWGCTSCRSWWSS